MYEVKVQEQFAAALRLPEGAGVCSKLHGHTYQVEAVVEAEGLDGCGFAMDAYALAQALRDCLAELDHGFLNEHPAFVKTPPSAENLSVWIFQAVAKQLPEGVTMTAVSVSERPDWRVTYRG